MWGEKLSNIVKAIEPLRVLARWLDPDRKREATKDGAIEAADELFKIYRALGEIDGDKGRYENMKRVRLKSYEEHFMKRYAAWRNG